MSTSADDLAIEFKNVDIFFGNGRGRRETRALAEAIRLADAGGDRGDILKSTGVVLGVTNASLPVQHGEINVLMGLSGSGKSTLLRAANGLNKVTRGQVLLRQPGKPVVDVASCDANTLRDVRMRRVAMVFQQFALLPWRTVRENVGLGLELRGVAPAEMARVVDEKLQLVGLDQWADRYASELSGGMQQRVGLARAFATDPDILLMDEPFSALDPLIRAKLQDELLALQASVKKTILFVSHDLDEAVKIGNHVSIMEGGRIVQTDTPEGIVLRPANAYVADFVQHMNPLTVLKAGTVMRAAGSLHREADGLWLDEERRYHVSLNEKGMPISARMGGEPLPVVPMLQWDPMAVSRPAGLMMVPANIPLRTLVQIRQASGHPVLLGDGGDFHGVCGDTDILGALSGVKRGSVPAR